MKEVDIKRRDGMAYKSVEMRLEESKCPQVAPEKNEDPMRRKFLSLVLALIAAMSFALNSLVSKMVVGRYSVFLIAMIRALGVFFPTLAFMLHARFWRNQKIFTNTFDTPTKLAVLFRGILGAVVTVSLTGALKYIGVGDTLVIKSCAPVFVAFFARCFLNESLGLIPVICGLQVILGVFCIAKPQFLTGKEEYSMETLIGTALALTVAVSAALGIICMRYSRKLHFSIPAFSMGIFGSLVSGIICAATGGFELPHDHKDALLFLATAICTAVTQILTVLALKYDGAGQTALVRTSEVFFGFILQITVLGVIPDHLSSIGAIIVILAVIISIASKK